MVRSEGRGVARAPAAGLGTREKEAVVSAGQQQPGWGCGGERGHGAGCISGWGNSMVGWSRAWECGRWGSDRAEMDGRLHPVSKCMGLESWLCFPPTPAACSSPWVPVTLVGDLDGLFLALSFSLIQLQLVWGFEA